MFPFSRAFAYACVCAATSENEIPLRHNTSTRIFTTNGYVWPMKTLNPDYLAPTQFSKMAEGSDDFACSCAYAYTYIVGVLTFLRLCLCLCANENQPLRHRYACGEPIRIENVGIHTIIVIEINLQRLIRIKI